MVMIAEENLEVNYRNTENKTGTTYSKQSIV